jgi:hypothetical protein
LVVVVDFHQAPVFLGTPEMLAVLAPALVFFA